jgi:signal recognition particle receptor subunit alpha
LTWVDKLIDNIKTLFVDLYRDQLKKPNTTIVYCPFDDYFDQQMRELEGDAGNVVVESPSFSDEKKEIPIDGDTGGPPPPLPTISKVKSLSTSTILEFFGLLYTRSRRSSNYV